MPEQNAATSMLSEMCFVHGDPKPIKDCEQCQRMFSPNKVMKSHRDQINALAEKLHKV